MQPRFIIHSAITYTKKTSHKNKLYRRKAHDYERDSRGNHRKNAALNCMAMNLQMYWK